MKIIAYIVLGISILILGLYGLSKYADWKFNRELILLKTEQERPYMEDTYGGTTPKETLDLFIAAVENNDFELASKYFVISKQEEWRRELEEIKKMNKLNEFLTPVLEEREKLKTAEPKWETEEIYISDSSVLFEFVKYPRGIWKIREI